MRFFQRPSTLLPLLLLLSPPFLSSQTRPSGEDPDSLFFSALRSQRAGDLTLAKQQARALLTKVPEYHDARVLYGRIHAWEGNFASAIAQFDSVLAAEPTHAEARFAKAQVLSWMGRYRQAADILESLVKESPTSVEFLIELGKVYLWGKAPRRALEYYERAILQDPNSVETMRGLGRIHRQLRSRTLSLYWYRKLLSRSPNDPEALAELVQQTYQADHEIAVRWTSESFVQPGFDSQMLLSAEYYLTVNEDWKPFLQFVRTDKFRKKENRFGGGTYVRLSYLSSLFVQVAVSPEAIVVPKVDALGDLSAGWGGGIETVFGYRFLAFDSNTVHVLSPGMTAYVGEDFWMTPRAYIGLGERLRPSTSWTLSLSYRPIPTTVVRLGGVLGHETFRASSLNELSRLKSTGGFLSLKSRVLPLVAVEASYQYLSRDLGSNSHQVSLGLSFLF